MKCSVSSAVVSCVAAIALFAQCRCGTASVPATEEDAIVYLSLARSIGQKAQSTATARQFPVFKERYHTQRM